MMSSALSCRPTPRTFAAWVAVAVAALCLGSGSSHALEKGDACTLKTSLSVSMRSEAGVIEATLDKGADIEVIAVGDGGSSVIRSGSVRGSVSTADLESACTGDLQKCTLTATVMMYEKNRSDSRSWRIKPGAEVSVLKRGKTWAALRVGDLQGFVKSDELRGNCVARQADDGGVVTDPVERGEGPGLLVLPMQRDGAVPPGEADALLDELFTRVAYYRPDAALAPPAPKTKKTWKKQVEDGARSAKLAETRFALIGRVAPAPAESGASSDARYLVELAIVDARTGKLLKGVRARPTMRPNDTWAELALEALLPVLPAAPESRLPSISRPSLEVAPNEAPAPERAKPVDLEPVRETPWIANGWGWLSLGIAALAGGGAVVAGMFALDENEAANATPATDPARSERRNLALAEAITADALTAVAASAAVTGIVVFATRAGLE
jgi:hypothetical protein